jgi:hypothetical protein
MRSRSGKITTCSNSVNIVLSKEVAYCGADVFLDASIHTDPRQNPATQCGDQQKKANTLQVPATREQ